MNSEHGLLDHEKLDVYRLAIDFLSLSTRLLDHLPASRREIRLQLERAAMSVPLNIAEGCGKPTRAERARFHGIARGSAMECGALLDVLRLTGNASPADVETGKVMLVRIVAMLTKMCR